MRLRILQRSTCASAGRDMIRRYQPLSATPAAQRAARSEIKKPKRATLIRRNVRGSKVSRSAERDALSCAKRDPDIAAAGLARDRTLHACFPNRGISQIPDYFGPRGLGRSIHASHAIAPTERHSARGSQRTAPSYAAISCLCAGLFRLARRGLRIRAANQRRQSTPLVSTSHEAPQRPRSRLR